MSGEGWTIANERRSNMNNQLTQFIWKHKGGFLFCACIVVMVLVISADRIYTTITGPDSDDVTDISVNYTTRDEDGDQCYTMIFWMRDGSIYEIKHVENLVVGGKRTKKPTRRIRQD